MEIIISSAYVNYLLWIYSNKQFLFPYQSEEQELNVGQILTIELYVYLSIVMSINKTYRRMPRVTFASIATKYYLKNTELSNWEALKQYVHGANILTYDFTMISFSLMFETLILFLSLVVCYCTNIVILLKLNMREVSLKYCLKKKCGD